MQIEKWKDVPGYEGIFKASNMGRILSLSRIVKTCYNSTRVIKEKIIAQTGGKRGYCRINYNNKTYFAHRFVALTWIENPNNLPYINHIDGIKFNNHPSNLEWCTHLQNMKHAYKTGLAKIKDLHKGEKSIASKLTENDVHIIREKLKNNQKKIDIAKEFDVVISTIRHIELRNTWSHI